MIKAFIKADSQRNPSYVWKKFTRTVLIPFLFARKPSSRITGEVKSASEHFVLEVDVLEAGKNE